MSKLRITPVILAVIVVVIALTVTGVVVLSGSGARRLQRQFDLGNRFLSELKLGVQKNGMVGGFINDTLHQNAEGGMMP